MTPDASRLTFDVPRSPFQPRAAQRAVLDYRGGYLGVAAVPGSGKTQTLSALAADLVARQIDDAQEVLIVTLVNAAVGNFGARIARHLAALGLPPRAGYRVRTLHGLAHDIVRERPGLVGLADDFTIVDERSATQIVDDAVMTWLRSHPDFITPYLKEDLEGSSLVRVRSDLWPDDCREMVAAFIGRAKDLRLRPELLLSQLSLRGGEFALARLAGEVYADYQRSLSYRGAVDFADLVGYAIDALRGDSDYCERLRQRWPFILEDEAQDSSALQQDLLALLAGPGGNWVRVGDPNQAVYQTFTTANPRLLRDFLDRRDVTAVEMDQSGRSAVGIVELANRLVDWACTAHPHPAARQAFRRQHIRPTDAGDPQPNPADRCEIHLHERGLSPEKEVEIIVASLARWLPEHPQETVAVLVPDNTRGHKFADALHAKGLPCVEMLNASTATRNTAEILARVLQLLAQPGERQVLRRAFAAWRETLERDKSRTTNTSDETLERDKSRTTNTRGETLADVRSTRFIASAPARGETLADVRSTRFIASAPARGETLAERFLGRCREPHTFLWPRGDGDYLDSGPADAEARAELRAFRGQAQRWQGAALLPIEQLVLTVAQDLFSAPGELALAHQFAIALRGQAEANPQWRLPELARELEQIASNPRRKFSSLAEDDNAFDPEAHKGQVVVATMHKAKGLEWDRVYLTALNNYDFPSGQSHDVYRSEKWYLRDSLDLGAEILAQLEALAGGQPYAEGEAGHTARLDYICERLRLFYVGITRARKDLLITWNSGRGRVPSQEAVALIALRTGTEGAGELGN